MAVSKRTRFEVLRRDSHACRYCGQSAPDVKLTVDHVVPTALGGADEPSNLVTACVDCNAGKASTSPDEHTVEQVEADALRWAEAMRLAAEHLHEELVERNKVFDAFLDTWDRWLPSDWENTVCRLYEAGLPIDSLIECAGIALRARHVESRWAYFCGVAWKRLAQMQDIASVLVRDL